MTSTLAAPPPPPAPVRPPTVEWARRFGMYGDDSAHNIVVAADGTIIVHGRYQFQIELDNHKLAAQSNLQGNPGSFLAGFSPDGKISWATDLHSRESDYINDMALGADDSVVFTGVIREMNAGCRRIRSTHFDDILVGSFSAKGRCLFTDAYGTKDNDSGQAIATDRRGNLYVFGTARSGTDFGGGKIQTSARTTAFAASFTKSGEHRWSLDIGGKASSYAHAAAIDADGNVYVAGYRDTSNAGDDAPMGAHNPDAWLLSLSSEGKPRWSTTFGGPKTDAANGVVVDPRSGDVIVVGSFSEFLEIGSERLVSAGGADGFAARYDKTGKLVWARSMGGPDHQGLDRVALDAAGNLYTIGYTRAPFKYGESELRVAGNSDVLVASMTPDGAPRWALSFGGPEYDAAYGLAVEPSGRVLVAGTFAAEADLGGTKLKSEGSHDMFLVALRP